MCAWPQMYSRTVRTPEVTHCQSLPCAVRLYLPPSQSASELQLCLPGSCCTQEIRGSVYVHSCGMWMWRNKFISAMKTIRQPEDGVWCLLWYFAAYRTCYSTLAQLPNYGNSLGMRNNFRLFYYLWKFKSRRRKQRGRRRNQGAGETRNFHLPLDTFPFPDLQLWCSLSSPRRKKIPEV